MGFNLGQYRIDGVLFLAPMAGVTDAPFRRLCRQFGADYAVGEMLASAPQLRNSRKTLASWGLIRLHLAKRFIGQLRRALRSLISTWGVRPKRSVM